MLSTVLPEVTGNATSRDSFFLSVLFLFSHKKNREIERLIKSSQDFSGVEVVGNEKSPRSGAFEVVVFTDDGKDTVLFSKLDTGNFPKSEMVISGLFFVFDLSF